MEVTIKGSAQEIAALVIAAQERRYAAEVKISEEEFISFLDQKKEAQSAQ